MHQGVASHLQTRYFRDIFDFFIKYVGSSAYRAPAFMNSLPTIQFRYDLWYVDGGLYNIALGLRRLMDELGIKINLNAEVSEVRREGGARDGPRRERNFPRGRHHRVEHGSDSGLRKIVARGQGVHRVAGKETMNPPVPGLVLDLGLDCQYPQLAHHNFFFSGHQREHFETVFQKRELPDDPTIYLVAASKTDPTVAPAGCDCLKILPHIPYIDDAHPLTREDYLKFKERIVDKLERMGLKDLRKHVVFEHVWTPLDIRANYNSNKGSIYGVVSDRWKNLAFKAPKQSTLYPNLFFVGGSVNPGGGMPMVVLCGQNVAKKIVAWDK